MLTRKQLELLTFINTRLQETGFSPSFEEMKTALDLKSKSGIHRLITALEERGFIRRLPHRARALEVVKMPDSVIAGLASKPGRPDARVIAADFGKSANRPKRLPPLANQPKPEASGSATPGMLELPLYGRIAAGTPIEALRDPETMIEIPLSMLGQGEHYALEIAGDSMVDAGILDGDTAIIQRCDNALSGDIVVALIDREEATLKRLRRKGNSVALEPANKTYETRIFGPDRVRIQGRLVGLLRKY